MGTTQHFIYLLIKTINVRGWDEKKKTKEIRRNQNKY